MDEGAIGITAHGAWCNGVTRLSERIVEKIVVNVEFGPDGDIFM